MDPLVKLSDVFLFLKRKNQPMVNVLLKKERQ